MAPGFEGDSTTRVSAASRGMRILSAELAVIDGPDRGLRAMFHKGVARVGTAPGMDLLLQDRTVSRVHCELRVRGELVSVKDCGSTNGTWVDGIRLRDGDAAAGSVLRIGGTSIRIEVNDQPSFVELSEATSFGKLVGGSLAMRHVYGVLERIALTQSTLLIQGETGTGKDVVARSLHEASPRANKPFQVVDCSSIPEQLFESELFGHVRGAFSGATTDRKGVFEEAHGGTLFLDEIGEMPLLLQAKLLRAIESRSVRPVGSNHERKVDVRIVAATNRPLAQAVNEGAFREDLFYRLAVVDVVLPPLRARREDIAVLAQHFYAQWAGEGEALPEAFLDSLQRREWPGNVRELRNYIERYVSLGFLDPSRTQSAPARQLPPSAVDAFVPLHLPLKAAREAWLEQFESIYVKSMLKQTGGNVTRAAELAGVSRRFLQRHMSRLPGRGQPDDDPE